MSEKKEENSIKISALISLAKEGSIQKYEPGIGLIRIMDETKLATTNLLEVRSIYRQANLSKDDIAELAKCRKRVRTRIAKRRIRQDKRDNETAEINQLTKERDELLIYKDKLTRELDWFKSNS